MNAKAKAKKNLIRIIALLLAGMIFIGMLAVGTNSNELTNTDYNFSKHLTKDGFFKNVNARELLTMPDYNAFEMPKSLTEVSDDVVMQNIETNILAASSTQEKDTSADRIAESGDKVNINFAGTVDGVAFEGGTSENYDLVLGSGSFIPGFEDAVIGHKVGENFDIDVTFPEDYGKEGTDQAELNGKAAVFNITINHMYKTITPELTDEFVKGLESEDYDSVESLKSYVKANLIESQQLYYVENMLFTGTTITGEVPQTVTTYIQEQLKRNLNSTGSQFGMTAEDMLTLYGFETMEEYYEVAGMEDYEKMYLLTQAYYEKEDLKPTLDEVKEYLAETNDERMIPRIITYYGESYLKQTIMYENMLEMLVEKMPVVDTAVSENTEAAE